jgi:hypothetical protein
LRCHRRCGRPTAILGRETRAAAGWALAGAEAECTAGSALAVTGLLRADLRGDDAPGDGDAAAELAESWGGADDDTEPSSADVPAACGYVNAGEFVAAQLPERPSGGYARERSDAGSRCGKPPRCDGLLCGGERVHDPESRRWGISAIACVEPHGQNGPVARAGSGPGKRGQ